MSSFKETFKQHESVLDAIFLDAVKSSNDEIAVGILPSIMGLVEGYSTNRYGEDSERVKKLRALKACAYLREIQNTKSSNSGIGLPRTLAFLFGDLILPALDEPQHYRVLSNNLAYRIGKMSRREEGAVKEKLRTCLETRTSAPSQAVQLLSKIVKEGTKPHPAIVSSLLHMVARFGDVEDYFRLMRIKYI